jgi:hypothetical protein
MCTPIIAGAFGLLGGVMQGIGAAQERENNAQTYEMNAAGLDRDIQSEKETSAYEVARTRDTIARTQGEARAGFASNGLALSGSTAEVLRDSAIEGDLDVAAIRWSSSEKQKSLAYQRDVYKYNAGQERGAKGLAFISPVISGAARFGGSFG